MRCLVLSHPINSIQHRFLVICHQHIIHIYSLLINELEYRAVKLKICHGRKNQLVVSCQVVTTPWCGLAAIFCGFILYLIGHETINIPEIFSGVHGFKGKTVSVVLAQVLFNGLRSLKLYVNFSNFELYHVLTYMPLLLLIQPNL